VRVSAQLSSERGSERGRGRGRGSGGDGEEGGAATHGRDLLEDRRAELGEERRADLVPVVLAEVQRAVLMRRGVGDVEVGLRREREGEASEAGRRRRRAGGATHPDEVDDEAVEEPEQELAQELLALVHVGRRRPLRVAAEPGARREGEPLKERVDRGRLEAAHADERRDACGLSVSKGKMRLEQLQKRDARSSTSRAFSTEPQKARGMTSATAPCTKRSTCEHGECVSDEPQHRKARSRRTSWNEHANSASFGLSRAVSCACVWPCGTTSDACEMSIETSPRETWVCGGSASSCKGRGASPRGSAGERDEGEERTRPMLRSPCDEDERGRDSCSKAESAETRSRGADGDAPWTGSVGRAACGSCTSSSRSRACRGAAGPPSGARASSSSPVSAEQARHQAAFEAGRDEEEREESGAP